MREWADSCKFKMINGLYYSFLWLNLVVKHEPLQAVLSHTFIFLDFSKVYLSLSCLDILILLTIFTHTSVPNEILLVLYTRCGRKLRCLVLTIKSFIIKMEYNCGVLCKYSEIIQK